MIMIRNLCLHILFVVTILPLGLCFGETWTAVCETNFPPYNFIDESGSVVGLDTEIVRAVLEEIDVELDLDIFPWERVLHLLGTNRVDFAYQFVGVPSRFEAYIMVGPFRFGRTVFAVKNDSDIVNFTGLKDFAGYKIGVVHGYSYTEEFDKARYLTKIENLSNEILIKRLMTGQIDIIVGDLMTLTYAAKNLECYDSLRFLERVLRVVPRYIAFAKDEPYKAARFEEGLEEIKKKGIFDRILMEWQ